MDATLRAKLEDIHERYDELGTMLCAPEIVADTSRLLPLTREHAELRNVAEAFDEYVAAERTLAETTALLADPDMKELAEGELGPLRERIGVLELQLQKLLVPRDPNDSKDVLLEIRAGTGGEEAALFAGELWRMYNRWA
ncbi:MAG TPA: PCRF domain-containing protein, partial [Nannocystaceae bacterium]|nr:PCRF domain-containing protein [Nannocystaceae bacterium]